MTLGSTRHHPRTARILVVDDEVANLELLGATLEAEGYTNVTCVRDSREVMDTFDALKPDLILLDLHMPELDGFEILRLLGERVRDEEFLPVLVLTADVTEETKQRALSGGATDFLTKPLNLSEALLRIGNLLHTRSLHEQQRLARRRAEEASRRATFLADASHVLAGSLDQETAVSVLCRTAVPRLADFCVIDLVREDGTIRRAGAAHANASLEALLRGPCEDDGTARVWSDCPIYATLPEDGRLITFAPDADVLGFGNARPSSGNGVLSPGNDMPSAGDAFASSESRLLSGDGGAPSPASTGRATPPEAAIPEAEIRSLLRGIVDERLPAPHALIVVPLLASGETHGAMVLGTSESERTYDADDLALARELARRAALAIENARLYGQALEATRARDELLAIVAHDLRNPISTVIMGASALLDEVTTPSQRSYADLVYLAAERMNRLVEDLLEAARVQNRKLSIQPRPTPPAFVVEEAVALLTPLAAARQIELRSRVAPDLPSIPMDAARVQQILSNLVGNALKFTPAGGRIEIVCEMVDGHVRFAVSDTGTGIPADQIPLLFGRFWQASDRDTRGVGLGLSIVRGIVEAHGGRVWVESEPGKGATFFFTLSGAPAGETPSAPPVLSAAPA